MWQVKERLQPGLLLATEVEHFGPVAGTVDDGQRRDQEDGLQGIVLSLEPTGIVDLDQQRNQRTGTADMAGVPGKVKMAHPVRRRHWSDWCVIALMEWPV